VNQLYRLTQPARNFRPLQYRSNNNRRREAPEKETTFLAQFPLDGLVWLVISPVWQGWVIDRPEMPTCPARAALIAATEKPIKRP
jgi:hypothetical protein